jgi:hypothetical protein
MSFEIVVSLLSVFLFFGMLAFSEVGRRIGIARLISNPDGLAQGGSAADGAVFGLLGLIVAFTFSGAASRLEDRRNLITEEANAIGTTYLRIDLLPEDTQPEMRELFRRYLDLRLKTYPNAGNAVAMKAKLDETATLQGEIWTKTVNACRRPEVAGNADKLVLPALNEMIDITTTRASATKKHPPLTIFLLLAGLSFIGAMLVGYSMSINKSRSWIHTIAFAAIMSLTIYVILDLEFPRLGLIRIDAADQVLVELRKSMN